MRRRWILSLWSKWKRRGNSQLSWMDRKREKKKEIYKNIIILKKEDIHTIYNYKINTYTIPFNRLIDSLFLIFTIISYLSIYFSSIIQSINMIMREGGGSLIGGERAKRGSLIIIIIRWLLLFPLSHVIICDDFLFVGGWLIGWKKKRKKNMTSIESLIHPSHSPTPSFSS